MINVQPLGPHRPRRFSPLISAILFCFCLSLLTGCGASRPPGASSGSSASTPPSGSTQPATAKQRQAFLAAKTLSSAGQDAEALQAFKDFVQRYPSSPLTDSALMALADLSLKREQPIQAQGYYRNLTERFPSSPLTPEAYLRLGILTYDMQHYVESETSLRLAINGLTIPQQQAQAYYYMGLNARQQQRYMEAFGAFNKAVEINADEALIRDAQSEIDVLMQNELTPEDLHQLADQYATTALGAQILLRLAENQREMQDITGEMATLQRLLTTFPDHPDLIILQLRLEVLEATMTTDATRVGVLLPLSGDGQQAGQRVLWGIELALSTLRARWPTLDISLRIRDTQGDMAVAGEALRELVTDEHVIAVIGPLFSQVATDLAPLTEELSVPVISPYARDSQFPFLSPYAFRNSLTDKDQARFLADYAIRVRNLTRFAVLYPDEPYGVSLKDAFIEQVIGLEGDVVVVSAYPPDANNFGQSIKRLGGIDDESLDDLLTGSGTRVAMSKTKPFEAIFLPGYYDRVGLMVPELAFYNITNLQLLGTDGWNSEDLIMIGENFVENAIFVDGFFTNSTAPSVVTFVQQFLDRYEERPTLFAAQGYDTMGMLGQLLQSGVGTRFELRDMLLQIRDFPAVTGLTSLDQDGNAIKTPYLLTIKDGRIVQLN